MRAKFAITGLLSATLRRQLVARTVFQSAEKSLRRGYDAETKKTDRKRNELVLRHCSYSLPVASHYSSRKMDSFIRFH